MGVTVADTYFHWAKNDVAGWRLEFSVGRTTPAMHELVDFGPMDATTEAKYAAVAAVADAKSRADFEAEILTQFGSAIHADFMAAPVARREDAYDHAALAHAKGWT